MTAPRRSRVLAVAAASLMLTIAAGCGDDSSASLAPPHDAVTSTEVTVTDPWVKAADSGMTAMFGTLTNTGEEPAQVVSASTPAADMVELHEATSGADGMMGMRPKPDGFKVPAAGTYDLVPGGDHIMMMGLTKPLRPGDTVTVELAFDDGSSKAIHAVVKEFSGAEEEYVPKPGRGNRADADK